VDEQDVCGESVELIHPDIMMHERSIFVTA
jgi:hypothetical protein